MVKCWNAAVPLFILGSLRKATAWLVHFKYLVALLNKDPDSIPKGPVTVSEIIAAESVIAKAVHHDTFPAELAVVGQRASGNQMKCISQPSSIRNLSPFVADTGNIKGKRLPRGCSCFIQKEAPCYSSE